jgi:hypothetical protein
MNPEIQAYNDLQTSDNKAVCNKLATTINSILTQAESKIWHAHPVWFIEGNPIVGYSKLKDSVRMLFWSGQSFEEEKLKNEGKFKAAELRFTSIDEIDFAVLERCLEKSIAIQWDYKNIIKRKGQLIRQK